MLHQVLAGVVLINLLGNGQSQDTCKNPTVVHRLLADDVRFASPFYVIALPNTPKTQQIDNVCYTYFETEESTFFHVMSVVYKNGSSSQYTFSKGDISNRMGLAQAKAEMTSPCVYDDYTLTPICNVTVFVLYRCFIEGNCNNIDIGITPGVDVRLVLAATTSISSSCLLEMQRDLKNTSSLSGNDYTILPQNRKPQCVTNFNNRLSINSQNALGSITLTDETAERFGVENNNLVFGGTTRTVPSQGSSILQQNPKTELPKSSSETKPSLVNQQWSRPIVTPYVIPQTIPKKSYADVVKSSLTPTKNRMWKTSPSYYHPQHHIHSWNAQSQDPSNVDSFTKHRTNNVQDQQY